MGPWSLWPSSLLLSPPRKAGLTALLWLTLVDTAGPAVLQEVNHAPQLLYDFPWSHVGKLAFLVRLMGSRSGVGGGAWWTLVLQGFHWAFHRP